MKEGFSTLTKEELDTFQERSKLIMSVPELWAASMNQISVTMRMISELVAERSGRSNDELEVITFAGAIMGVMISVIISLGFIGYTIYKFWLVR